MFKAGDVIDGGYAVTAVCSDSGGMGTILFVTPLKNAPQFPVVLKYCKDNGDEQLKRFRREVRLLQSFEGNSRIVQIIDANLDHDPPYFVMKYYPDGDLTKLLPQLQGSLDLQERYFLQMIDCLQELHSRNEFHRDIKPQNFLLDGEHVVVADFGLTTEIGSGTAFTRSSVWWGTHGYIPPEFMGGGFKHADAAGDVFMLGKTFYVLLTGREPMYLLNTDVPPPLFHIIERCCNVSKAVRYQSLSDLRQSIVAAYDVLLGRAGGIGKVKQLLSSITDRLEQQSMYTADEVSTFIEQLSLLDDSDQTRICEELPRGFFSIMRQEPLVQRLTGFLDAYEKLVESQSYSWSYAETIAKNMRTLFDGDAVPLNDKARALDLAIRAAYYMNRFAAMDTCRTMVRSIRDEALGLQVAAVLLKQRDTFISDVETSECESELVRNALRQIQSRPTEGDGAPAVDF